MFFKKTCYVSNIRQQQANNKERLLLYFQAHPTNPVEGCADANPKTELPNDT